MFEVVELGLVPYLLGRAIQEDYLHRRVRGECPDTLLICEHPPTLSCGIRTEESHLLLSEGEWGELGVEIVQSDRAGGPTLHLPGQVVFYPVVSLRGLGFGVRAFVERFLGAMASGANSLGVELHPSLNPPGVWLGAGDEGALRVKVGFAGLRIRRGVTDHGFCLNVNCDLELFSHIAPCGLCNVVAGSLAQQQPKVLSKERYIQAVLREIERTFFQGTPVAGADKEFAIVPEYDKTHIFPG